MNKVKVKSYAEENIIIKFLIIHNVHLSYKARDFKAHSFSVAKSNGSPNLHGLLKYFGSINPYLKSSGAGQHRTNLYYKVYCAYTPSNGAMTLLNKIFKFHIVYFSASCLFLDLFLYVCVCVCVYFFKF